MPLRMLARRSPPPSLGLTVILFVLSVALMGWLKIGLFPQTTLALTYGLPLLICLWHKDRRLLWALTGAFLIMASAKNFLLLAHPEDSPDFLLWAMQMANILVIALAVQSIMNLTKGLQEKNEALEHANVELVAREEEISRQNEELQSQAEELANQNEELQTHSEEINQQNEELQQQSEELQQQAEELQTQAESLQSANSALQQRQAMLQTILNSLREVGDEQKVLARICQSLVDLSDGRGQSAAVLEQVEDELVVRTYAGTGDFDTRTWPLARSFAAIVMQTGRTAYIDDLEARPDLVIPQPADRPFRSFLVSPLRIDRKIAGVVRLSSYEPRHWTQDDFRTIEWVAAQCSIILDCMRLHDHLRQAKDSLADANANLENVVKERTAKLQEMVEELEHFSYSITHDMRAPLRAMQGFAALLQEECEPALSDYHKSCLSRITNSANRMDRLITDALSYSKAVRQELTLSEVDTSALLKGIIDSYPILQPPRATIEIQGELPWVRANEAGLTQCFSNVLGNAVKFVEKGKRPHIRVRAERNDTHVRLWFEDNGIGIPDSFKDRVFGMFQRGSKDYEGTGIGLALVRKMAERMGGRVGVISRPGQGSRFWLELKCGSMPEDKSKHNGKKDGIICRG